MTPPWTPAAVARGLVVLFTALWWWILIASCIVGVLVLFWGANVGVQIGPNGEPNFVFGSAAQMVLPVAFELEPEAAKAASADGRISGTVERASGLIRLTTPDRTWMAVASAVVMIALTLWMLAELTAVCRSIRDGQPFVRSNAGRIRRLAAAVVLAEVSRAAIVYAANAYVAGNFAADHLRFAASPRINAPALVSALILLVLAEVFRTGTQLDEEQSLTV